MYSTAHMFRCNVEDSVELHTKMIRDKNISQENKIDSHSELGQIHAGLDEMTLFWGFLFLNHFLIVGWIVSVDTKIASYNKKDQSFRKLICKASIWSGWAIDYKAGQCHVLCLSYK